MSIQDPSDKAAESLGAQPRSAEGSSAGLSVAGSGRAGVVALVAVAVAHPVLWVVARHGRHDRVPVPGAPRALRDPDLRLHGRGRPAAQPGHARGRPSAGAQAADVRARPVRVPRPRWPRWLAASSLLTDFRADLPKIDIPTLVIHGTADRILPFESTAARLRDEKLIADLTVVEVKDGPHNIGWTFPDETNSAILDFLAR